MYKKVVKFSFTQQKIFWVLVFITRICYLAYLTNRSIVAHWGQTKTLYKSVARWARLAVSILQAALKATTIFQFIAYFLLKLTWKRQRSNVGKNVVFQHAKNIHVSNPLSIWFTISTTNQLQMKKNAFHKVGSLNMCY